MSKTVEVKIPDIGDFDEVDVIEVLVAEGDRIEAEQSLVTVESDKASMEIPSPESGLVKSVKVKVGDKVKEGSVILVVEQQDAGASEPPPAQEPAAAEAPAPDEARQAPSAGDKAPAGQGKAIAVQVPDIGDATDVEVIEILVGVGDTIAKDQSLITLESDKASMEVPSTSAGVVSAIKVKLGDKVSEGSVILELEAEGDSEAPAPAPAPPAAAADRPADSPPAKPAAEKPEPESAARPAASEKASPTAAYPDSELPKGRLPHASPSVRKFARELGVDLHRVEGSAAKGRITHDDVRGFVKKALAGQGPGAPAGAGTGLSVLDWPKVDFARFGPIETTPLSRIRKISGANLHRNWVMIPHVTNHETADITDLEAFRKQLNKENSEVKLTLLAFLISSVVAALKKFPEFNASLDGENLITKQYYHIGFAADTPNGLVVPVIRDADRKGILELAAETAELAGLAREGKLSPAQMQGGCFSISSLGGIGGTQFTPIINAPEVAILGVSRASMAPVWDGEKFKPRLMLPLSLSYDHRVIDGAAAARFNAYLSSLLADFRRVAL